MSRLSFGSYCVVRNCSNNWGKLKMWKETPCEIHEEELHKYCPCVQPFTLHQFSKEEKMRQLWINALQRKNCNPKNSVVSSCNPLE